MSDQNLVWFFPNQCDHQLFLVQIVSSKIDLSSKNVFALFQMSVTIVKRKRCNIFLPTQNSGLFWGTAGWSQLINRPHQCFDCWYFLINLSLRPGRPVESLLPIICTQTETKTRSPGGVFVARYTSRAETAVLYWHRRKFLCRGRRSNHWAINCHNLRQMKASPV